MESCFFIADILSQSHQELNDTWCLFGMTLCMYFVCHYEDKKSKCSNIVMLYTTETQILC